MKQRKKHIIETAIDLFAKKGFYSTSIQEIADTSGVSKGSVYLHFRSKDELLLEIFRYYFGRIQKKISRVEEENLSPKENFKKQLLVQFEEMIKHKDFLIMQFREQIHSTNQEVGQFLRTKKYESYKRYETHLYRIYGGKVEPYIVDGSLLLEGIKNAYFQIMMFKDLQIDLSALASFLIRRLDDLINGMLDGQETPIVTKNMIQPLFQHFQTSQGDLNREIYTHIHEMEKILNVVDMEDEKKTELQGALEMIREELQKPEPKKFVIQGMLANFKGIEAFSKPRRYIAERLDLQLL